MSAAALRRMTHPNPRVVNNPARGYPRTGPPTTGPSALTARPTSNRRLSEASVATDFSGRSFTELFHNMSDGEAIAKPFEVPEAPDDLFCRRDFQQLRIFRPGMAIDDERVSIGKTLDHRDPCQSDS